MKFTQFSRYALTMVTNPRARMSKFILGVSEMVVKKGCIAVLINEIDVSHLMIHAQQIKEEKPKKRLGRKIGKRPLIVTFNSQGLMDMVILGFNKDFPVKVHPTIQLLITKK